MTKSTKVKIGILLFLLIVIATFYNLLLYYFGASTIVIPLIICFSQKKYIIFFLIISYIIDILGMFSYSFLGTFGETLWKLNNKTFGLAFIGYGVFLLINSLKSEKKDLFSERKNPIRSNENLKERIDKLMISYNIESYVDTVVEGSFITRYNLIMNSSVSSLRFEGLSIEFSNELNCKVENVLKYNAAYIDVENKNKNIPILKEVYTIKQPNHISIFDSVKGSVILNFLRNMWISVSEQVMSSLLANMLVTKFGVDLIVFNSKFVEFSNAFEFVHKDHQIYLESIIQEMNRRYAIILPYGRNMDEYETSFASDFAQAQKFPRKILVLFHIEQFDQNYIEYILKYGKTVGIYIYNVILLGEDDSSAYYFQQDSLGDFSTKANLASLFEYKLLGPQKRLMDKGEWIHTHKLCHEYDCLFKTPNGITRIAIPISPLEERIRITKFHNGLHKRFK